MMRFISLFSGIGGFDLGFERAGMTCVAQVERDKKALEVLARHWAEVPRFEDVRDVGRHNLPDADVLCGGFPCQDVSIAGRRAGLVGERSGLWFEFQRITGELRPRFVVIENVPGLLSSNGGRDFAVILQGLVEHGYRVSWRVLDAQYFGLAQRRKRVFIVGSLRRGASAEILLESESVRGHSPAGREAGEGTADDAGTSAFARGIVGTLAASGAGTSRPAGQGNELDMLVCAPATFQRQRSDKYAAAMVVDAIDVRNLRSNGELSGTLQSKENGSYSLNYQNPVHVSSGIRRLTPIECERLQGFPDGWTDGQSDAVRYRQLGNAVAVPVAEWIGCRLMRLVS